MLHLIITIIGIVTTICLALYLILALLYMMLKKDVPVSIDSSKMPRLSPLPIPTLNHSFLMRIIVWIFEVRKWKLLEDWRYKLSDGTEIILSHKNFDFDGASIPRPLWAVLNPIGLLLIPGLIHDYGYKYDQLWHIDMNGEVKAFQKGAGKDYWDRLFKEVGKQVNGFALIDTIAYLAVKYGGGSSWKKHRQANKQAHKPGI